MAAFDYFGDMYDVALKPRLLDTLIRDHLPDKDHPFSNPSEISKVVSLVKTHSLLSESFNESMKPKLVQAWKSAVTSWLNRILTLFSTSMPDKCWAGISLLGVTCEECSSDRFLESYTLWFQKLLTFLQSPTDSHLVRVAACASISDLLARLSRFPKLKKEGSSCALKVVQPVLKMLHNDNSEAIWEAAVHVLCTLITSFPFSIQRHYDSVETAIAVKLLSGGCSLDMLKKLTHCLSLLPKSKGDEESWSVMMQKILILINDQLNSALQGLEEETMRKACIRLLVLPGKQPLPPLGGYVSTEEANNRETKRSEQSLMSNVSILLSGCCMLLTNTYPVKVNVPVRVLLTLIERILMVNGALSEMSLPFVTSSQQENICSELPVLHLCSLELLTAIIKATGSQLLPQAASIVNIITKYFKTCALPELRIKFYSVAKSLLISMGVGMALCLAQDVVNNAIIDLSSTENKNGSILNGSNSAVSTGTPLPANREKRKHGNTNGPLPEYDNANHKKRKHGNTNGPLPEYDNGGGLGVEVPKNRLVTPISLRIAALEALEALLTVAGSLRSEQWRSKVDSLLIVIAKDSFKEGSYTEEVNGFTQKEPATTATDLQLAAMHALLASFLSSQIRPPYLAQGLELFRRGKQQIGTKLAEFCAHAMLALEVLIHPRALPLVDYSVCANNNTYDEAPYNFRNNSTSFGSPQAISFDKWIENDDDDEAVEDPKILDVAFPSSTNIQERSEMVSETATCADVEMRTVEGEIILKSDQPHNHAVIDTRAAAATDTEIEPESIVSDSTILHSEVSHVELAPQSDSSLQRTSDSSMVQEIGLKLNNDNSVVDEDSFPDIVDEDPDSDSVSE